MNEKIIQSSKDSSSEDLSDDESAQHMPWIRKLGTIFQSNPLEINADIETVWKHVTNIAGYSEYSNGAVYASIAEGLEVDKIIKLELYKNELTGTFIPASYERISIVDGKSSNRKVVGWERKLPDGSVTERYHVLEKIDDDHTISFI